MRLLVSGSTATVQRLAQQVPEQLGHLLVPRNRNSVASLLATGLPWAADNGAFLGLDAPAFRRLLGRVAGQPRLLWICVPDVVGDAQATRALFDEWSEEVGRAGPLAYVGQDGAEDMEHPWERFAAWFIGGSTRWKLSQASADLAREAKARGKWVHMGRVNSLRRLLSAYDMGCDSVDGSSMSMYGDKYIHAFARWIRSIHQQPSLFPVELTKEER